MSDALHEITVYAQRHGEPCNRWAEEISALRVRCAAAEDDRAALVEAMREAYLSRSWVPVERVLARIESAEDVISKWMPIDTAPKFGEVLVYCADTAEQMVAFHAGGSMWQFAVTPSHKVCCRPTHWMPLPEPPVNSTESAETVHD